MGTFLLNEVRQITKHDILPIIKVLLLFTYCKEKIIFRKVWLVFDIENRKIPNFDDSVLSHFVKYGKITWNP